MEWMDKKITYWQISIHVIGYKRDNYFLTTQIAANLLASIFGPG